MLNENTSSLDELMDRARFGLTNGEMARLVYILTEELSVLSGEVYELRNRVDELEYISA